MQAFHPTTKPQQSPTTSMLKWTLPKLGETCGGAAGVPPAGSTHPHGTAPQSPGLKQSGGFLSNSGLVRDHCMSFGSGFHVPVPSFSRMGACPVQGVQPFADRASSSEQQLHKTGGYGLYRGAWPLVGRALLLGFTKDLQQGMGHSPSGMKPKDL